MSPFIGLASCRKADTKASPFLIAWACCNLNDRVRSRITPRNLCSSLDGMVALLTKRGGQGTSWVEEGVSWEGLHSCFFVNPTMADLVSSNSQWCNLAHSKMPFRRVIMFFSFRFAWLKVLASARYVTLSTKSKPSSPFFHLGMSFRGEL